jgi:hypothetical protein
MSPEGNISTLRCHDSSDDGEPYITARDATALFPSGTGKACHVSSLIRQVTCGHKLRGGGKAYLQADRGPGGWLFKRSWVRDYIRKITADRLSTISRDNPEAAAQQTLIGEPRSPSERKRAAEAAVAECRSLGV